MTTIPYYYRILDLETGIYYLGCKFAQGCSPETFWVSGGYFTSSETIHSIIEESGTERFKVCKVVPMKDPLSYETRVLKKLDCKNHSMFYNQHNNDFGDCFHGFHTETYKKGMMNKWGVEHPSKHPEIRSRIRETNKKVIKSEEWKKKLSEAGKRFYSQDNIDEIDKPRRIKISKFCKDNPDYRKEVSNKVKETVYSEDYRNNVEPQRVQKIIECSKKDGKRVIVQEIKELKDNLHYILKRKLTKELGIKQGWYRKKDEELSIMLLEVKKWIEEQ